MRKKKVTPKRRESRRVCGKEMIEVMLSTFERAYHSRLGGNTLEGLLIEVDITVAYNSIPADIHFAIRHATKSGVNAADAKMPLEKALAVLQKELDNRLNLLLEE